ncbi:hypothetical protein [Pontibacter sp. HSC-36F09]|uniref:hypothetical protein n=1 Tax=Pontibacter sp. HSC-36F09 TaxID=2910966 RepID=UPI00209FC3E5|nr:hypothetical protein [Pontibacter sp. HSC-36F09]MCP2042525.1 hypothetical protein [Pontibacter sp. HSC-36F09]
MKFNLLLLAALLPFYCLGQHALVGDPTYNKTVPRLIMMKHNESSGPLSNTRISPTDFEGKMSSKETNIFVTYKRNEKVGSTVGNYAELTVPPNRLMDFHLIYGYNYSVFIDEATATNGLRFNIALTPNDKVQNKSLASHALQKGKVISKKVSSKSFEISQNDSSLTVNIAASNLTAGSYLTFNVQVSSVNFGEIGPFGIENTAYTDFVSFNMPEIFLYDLVAQDVALELISQEKRPYELLHFKRDKEGTIDKFKIDNYSYKWKINPKSSEGGYKFKLTEMLFPEKKDIGITPADLLVL